MVNRESNKRKIEKISEENRAIFENPRVQAVAENSHKQANVHSQTVAENPRIDSQGTENFHDFGNAPVGKLKIGDIELKNDLVMAPLAGFTNVGFRALCRRYGAALTYTEMVSMKALYYGNENTEVLLATDPTDCPAAVQLFGSDVSIIEKVLTLPALQKFSVIDLNCGCPVPKIVKNGEGSALLRDPDLVYRLVREMKRVSGGRAVTVKTRKGFQEGDESGLLVAEATEMAGGDAVTIHARTRDMFYSGSADYSFIKKVKHRLAIPVVGNGDVCDRESYLRMKREAGADAVMIGRAAIGNPKIFSEILELPFRYSRRASILFEISKLQELLPDSVVASQMKKQVAYYLKGLRGVKGLKEQCFATKNIEELLAVVEKIPN